eukprot:191819-Alexandrium_andersonii.AAC.1
MKAGADVSAKTSRLANVVLNFGDAEVAQCTAGGAWYGKVGPGQILYTPPGRAALSISRTWQHKRGQTPTAGWYSTVA